MSDDLGEPFDPAEFRAASAWRSMTAPPTGVEVLIPDGWSARTDLAGPAVVTMISPPSGRTGDFRPSIIVTVEQPVEELRDIGEYTRAMTTDLRARLTDAHIIAIDPLWVGGYEGRRVITGYREGQHTPVAQQYWAVTESGVATAMTGTSSIEQYEWATEIFAHVAAGLSVATQLGNVPAAASGEPA